MCEYMFVDIYIHINILLLFYYLVKLLDLSYLSHSVFNYLSNLSQFIQMVTILTAFDN